MALFYLFMLFDIVFIGVIKQNVTDIYYCCPINFRLTNKKREKNKSPFPKRFVTLCDQT